MSPAAKALRVLISSALTLGALELLFRSPFAGLLGGEPPPEMSRLASVESFTRPSVDPELAYELIPGTRIQWLGVPVTIHDDEPRRVPERPLVEPADAVRIALVGDSTPFGWAVSYDQGYGERLRRVLEDRWGRAVALRNYAVPGYNSQQNRVTLEQRVLPWKPELLLLHFDHNDADPILTRPETAAPPDAGDDPLHSALLGWTLRRLRAIRGWYFGSTLASAAGEDRLIRSVRYAGPHYERHLREIDAMARLASERGIPVLAFVFTMEIRSVDDPRYEQVHLPLLRKLEGLGFVVVDLFGPARALMAEQGWEDLAPFWLTRLDRHPNAAGHAFIADVIQQALAGRPELAPRAGSRS